MYEGHSSTTIKVFQKAFKRLRAHEQYKFAEHRPEPELCIYDQSEISAYTMRLRAVATDLFEGPRSAVFTRETLKPQGA